MTIIKADIEQLDHILPLFDAYRVWYRKSSDLAEAKAFLSARLEQKDSVIFLAMTDEGQAVGFTQLYPSFSSTRMQRLWILNDLFVAPSHRGQHLSKRLIDAAKDYSKKTNACGVLLETEQSNIIGNKLYPKVGFELEQNNFYFWTNK